MKYLTPKESRQYLNRLEQEGFDLLDWEWLEMQLRLVQEGAYKRMGETGFDLMDMRGIIEMVNREFDI